MGGTLGEIAIPVSSKEPNSSVWIERIFVYQSDGVPYCDYFIQIDIESNRYSRTIVNRKRVVGLNKSFMGRL